MLKLFQRKPAATPEENLREVLGERELPTFPAVVTRALQSLRNLDAPLAEAGDSIEADPGLSVRVLRTVNSAALSMRHEIRSIHHALSLLGRNQVESILIGAAVRDAIPNKAARGFEAKRFWGTSAVRAVVAGHLAELIDPSRRSECFTASLLQDLAVPLLAQEREDERTKPKRYSSFRNKKNKNGWTPRVRQLDEDFDDAPAPEAAPEPNRPESEDSEPPRPPVGKPFLRIVK